MSNDVLQNKLVLIGRVTGTHGIKGQLAVVPFSGDADSIISRDSLIFMGDKGETDVYNIRNSSVHQKKVLITLDSLEGINQVEHLVGREVYVKREQLPELPDGEYYWCDLIGLKVFTTKGECLGELKDVLAGGSHDIYMVKAGDREYMIPAVEGIVTAIDLDGGVMTVDPPDGLLDI